MFFGSSTLSIFPVPPFPSKEIVTFSIDSKIAFIVTFFLGISNPASLFPASKALRGLPSNTSHCLNLYLGFAVASNETKVIGDTCASVTFPFPFKIAFAFPFPSFSILSVYCFCCICSFSILFFI